MNIQNFKRGDLITRVNPTKQTAELAVAGISADVIDYSYIGEKLKYVGIANGLIYFEVSNDNPVTQNELSTVELCRFSDGWEYWVDPEKVFGDNCFQNSLNSNNKKQQAEDPDNFSEEKKFSNEESQKQFYLNLAYRLCPTTHMEQSEYSVLNILYTRLKRICKWQALLINYNRGNLDPLVLKGCGIFLMDPDSPRKERKNLNQLLYDHSKYITKINSFNDVIRHDHLFFSQALKELAKILNKDPNWEDEKK